MYKYLLPELKLLLNSLIELGVDRQCISTLILYLFSPVSTPSLKKSAMRL